MDGDLCPNLVAWDLSRSTMSLHKVLDSTALNENLCLLDMHFKLFILCIFGASFRLWAASPDWSEGAAISPQGRSNPYQFSEAELSAVILKGRLHAQIYPVEITGSLPPYQPVKDLVESQDGDFFRRWLSRFIRSVASVHSFDDIENKLGLNPYPLESDQGVYSVPYPQGHRPTHRLGFGLIERDGARGFTFSCAACHSSRLFGKTVLGMTNRFPRANEFILQGQAGISATPTSFFTSLTHASRAEAQLYRETKTNISYVALRRPQTLGLDTSLSQVALSLDLRAPTPWAEKDPRYRASPSPDWLDDHAADSKPAVWWNIKYKNRWLSDGSVVSGNPIATNILWNEIGRGVDLPILSRWLNQNTNIIREITAAVFASEAPFYTDFFPPESIDLLAARRGEKIFESNCARCHGHYQKNWDLLPVSALLRDRLKTYQVIYHKQTPVIDVGTDPLRWQGMGSLEKLNGLAISQNEHILIRPQRGYVPPPLVGIWARWPYLHNNSIPSLCALLTRAVDRPKIYWSRPAENAAKDFDAKCNGYPESLTGTEKDETHRFDTRWQGLGNSGHDEGLFLKNGREILTSTQKQDLIQFLQTL
jgi:mono/diheme cytochrome c family protein